jgi:hypothetical protein
MTEGNQWHYGSGEKAKGPIGEEELRRLFRDGEIKMETLVWHPGMTDWVPLSHTELVDTDSPPPLPPGGSPNPNDLGQNAGVRLLLPVGRSGYAIAAGYAALFALFLVIPAPFALIFGIMAIRDIKRHPEKHGLGRAWFGIIVGTIITALVLAFMVFAVFQS